MTQNGTFPLAETDTSGGPKTPLTGMQIATMRRHAGAKNGQIEFKHKGVTYNAWMDKDLRQMHLKDASGANWWAWDAKQGGPVNVKLQDVARQQNYINDMSSVGIRKGNVVKGASLPRHEAGKQLKNYPEYAEMTWIYDGKDDKGKEVFILYDDVDNDGTKGYLQKTNVAGNPVLTEVDDKTKAYKVKMTGGSGLLGNPLHKSLDTAQTVGYMDDSGNYQAIEPTDVTHDIEPANTIKQTAPSNAVTPAINIDDIIIVPDSTEGIEFEED
tara:strand:- start:98 stop:907 length:810 start_codon:yes stop_codon:yes gene_type:complete